jgi:hypothetical protein
MWKHRPVPASRIGVEPTPRHRWVPFLLITATMLLAACGPSATTATTVPSSTTTTAGSVPSGSGGSPPAVPTTGAYLGAWLHPAPPGTGGSFALEQQTLPSVRAATGRALGILHVYVAWDAPAPIADLHAVAVAGSIPMLDWGCAPNGPEVESGADDSLISSFADALASYGGPVLLRWCWEMNLVETHPEVGGPSGFTSAWLHIRSLFTRAGATNVSFVWCPAVGGVDPAPYYPGDASVDWIGVDGYDRDGAQTFTSLFSAFYANWIGHGKPMMVGETGSDGSAQGGYIASIGTGMPTLPGFKAVAYFDAPGPLGSWQFTPTGLQAFAALARDPYFSPT